MKRLGKIKSKRSKFSLPKFNLPKFSSPKSGSPKSGSSRINFHDMKVKQRLLAGFMLASFVSLILAGVGFYSMLHSMQTENVLEARAEAMPDIANAITDISMIQSQAVQAALSKSDAMQTQHDYGSNSATSQNSAFEAAKQSVQKYDKSFKSNVAKVRSSANSDEWRKRIDGAKSSYESFFLPDIQGALDAAESGNGTTADTTLQQTGSMGQAIITNFTDFMKVKIQDARDAYAADVANEIRFFILMIVLAAVGIAGSIFLGIRMANDISKPLKDLEGCAGEMTKGNLKVRSSYQSKDEIGVLAASLNAFFAMLQEQIDNVSNALTDMAKGKYDNEPMPQLKGDLKPISDAVNQVLANMNQIFGGISSAAGQVDGGSSQVSSGAQALAQGASEQAGAVEELSASIADVSSEVKQNSESIAEIVESMNAAAEEADTGNSRMKDMLEAMNGISSSSQEIGKIIKVIDNIAFQTNILALNASVEAARAGEAGKGFAVVAEEVRNLAGKSAEAAKQTSQLIGNSANKVKEGFTLAESTAESLTGIAEKVKAMDSAVRRIKVASDSQTKSIVKITAGVDQVSKVVQTNSSTAEQSAAASEELSAQAERLRKEISFISLRAEA